VLFHQDPWLPVRGLIEHFNLRRQEVLRPGEKVTVDECMSSWRGKEFYESAFAMPHKTKIMRKPKGVGCEIKSAADVDTGIMIRLEILEGRDIMSTKKYVSEYGASTAVTLRLVEHLRGTARTIIADSAFASVKTATALLKFGLHFMGAVKTAHRDFPKEYMTRWSQNNSNSLGSHLTLKTVVATTHGNFEPIFGVCWKDKKSKYFVCTRGTTVPGNPVVRTRYRKVTTEYGYEDETYEDSLNIPSCVQEYFEAFPIIDIHDHYRQGSLALETSWRTKNWWHRVFATIFGIIVTDAYFCYKYDREENDTGQGLNINTFKKFTRRLVIGLTANQHRIDSIALRNRNTIPVNDNSVDQVTISFLHYFVYCTLYRIPV
jgi:hypothetical protein